MCRRVLWSLQLTRRAWLSLHVASTSCSGLHHLCSAVQAPSAPAAQQRESLCPASADLLAWLLQDALSSLFARVVQSRVVPASELLEWGTVDSMLGLMRKSGSTDVTRGSAALFLSEAAQQLEDVSCLHQAGAVAALLGEQRST